MNEPTESQEPLPPVPPPTPVRPLPERGTFWAMLLHLSALTGFASMVGLFPVGFFLGPVIVWTIKKEQFPELTVHFKEAINFQISLFIYLLLCVLLSLVTFGVALILTVPALLALMILEVLFPIIAGIQANDGKTFHYPLSIQIVK